MKIIAEILVCVIVLFCIKFEILTFETIVIVYLVFVLSNQADIKDLIKWQDEAVKKK